MKIQNILFINGILIDLKAWDKKDALTQMARFLASINNVKDRDLLVQKVLEREIESSTGIGFGIAIPHARLDIIDGVCMIAARCVPGLDFDSLDNKPVHLIFMTASSNSNSDDLRNILSSLSKIMFYEEMRDRLLSASDPETFLNLLYEGENKYVKE